jgi:glyoxylase-like metal-dependent hydrolase (beta-lactamase superfamily II)
MGRRRAFLTSTAGRGSLSAVLEQVAEGVLVHESAWCQSNAVVVQGATGVLVIDPGIHGDELTCLANDLARLGENVAAGFSTHPHWDHLLWHVSLGSPPRYGTELTSTTARDRLVGGLDSRRLGIPDDTPLDLVGLISGLPAGSTRLPWDGTDVRIIEHRAHAPGHAALLITERGVLVAGDMLSDVFIPMLDLSAADPIEDYLEALQLFEASAAHVAVVVRWATANSCSNESSRIGPTCTPCGTVTRSVTPASAPRPNPDGSGCGAFTNASCKPSPPEAKATARSAEDRSRTSVFERQDARGEPAI